MAMHSITLHDLPDETGKPVGHTLAFPGSWQECPAEHFAQVVLARAAPTEHGGVRLELLRLLAGIPTHLVQRLPPAEHFTRAVNVNAGKPSFYANDDAPEYEMRLLPELDWVFAAPHMLQSKLPTFAHGGTTWAGPDDNLTHMSLDQWRWCVKLLKQFRSEQEDEQREAVLNNLLGALYVPGNSRDAWSSAPIEENAALLMDLPLGTKIAAAFNFEALNAVLPRQYRRTFGGEQDGPSSPQGVLDISYDVAESGALGDYDEVNARLLHTVLGYMENNLYKDECEAERAKAAAAT